MMHRMVRSLAPIAALAMGALLAGCDGVNLSIDGDAVRLSELDMSGDAPTELVLAGPDHVTVAEGDKLDIDVSGDAEAIDALRFSLDEGKLAISREDYGSKTKGIANVNVTLPTLSAIVHAGSGAIDAASLRGDSEVTVVGSGTTRVARVDADKLDMTIAGSGTFEGAGTARTLDLTLAGSGSARMAELKAERADISIAGSGDAEFASDGKVEANILGSGNVRVVGSADCTINAAGSGSLRCQAAATPSSKNAGKEESGEAAGDAE